MKAMSFIILVLIANVFMAQAQTLSTLETKVILVTNDASDHIKQIVLFNTFQEMERKQVIEKYGDGRFYIGLFRGSYTIEKDAIRPLKGAMITIYTERQFCTNERFFPKEDLNKGDDLIIGSTRAKIRSNSKGELVLVTQ